MAASFSDIYETHLGPVWRYVRVRVPADADAEDVVSEVFAEAMRGWHGYAPERGPVRAWLIGIARHVVADWWSRRAREVPVRTPDGRDDGGDGDPESAALRRDGVDTLRRHLAMLTPREREAIALRFGTQLTSEEIGAAMGISPPAARMLVYRGVARLREVMDP